jgi:thermitase
MNRNNIWIHGGVAVILITLAAVFGQIDRWRAGLHPPERTVTKQVDKKVTLTKLAKAGRPEVFVRFKPGVSIDEIRAIASANHDVLTDEIESVSGLSVIDDLDDRDAKSVSDQYAAMTNLVVYAEPNAQIKLDDPVQKDIEDQLKSELKNKPVVHDGLYRTYAKNSGAPNDPLFDAQWALNNNGQDGGKLRADIGALEAWATTKGSDEIVVAVLDTGVDFTHIDLVNNMWVRPANVPEYTDNELGAINDINGYNGTDSISDPMDDNGHGTHCAGIIGAEGDNGVGISGINQHVKIMPLKFLGRGGFGSTDAAIEAINYAIDRRQHGVNVRVISASWGSTSKSKALEDVIRAAGDAGILFVAAAGNDGSDNDRRGHYPSHYDLPNVISVAALDRNDQLASFSNYGAKTVHVAAPGKDILSTWLNDEYREASGTSMATPYVSGVAALIISSEPDISMKDLRARILAASDGLDSLKGKVSSGGRVCAVDSLGNIVKRHPHR